MATFRMYIYKTHREKSEWDGRKVCAHEREHTMHGKDDNENRKKFLFLIFNPVVCLRFFISVAILHFTLSAHEPDLSFNLDAFRSQ